MAIRTQCAIDALQDVCSWLESGGEVAVSSKKSLLSGEYEKFYIQRSFTRSRPTLAFSLLSYPLLSHPLLSLLFQTSAYLSSPTQPLWSPQT